MAVAPQREAGLLLFRASPDLLLIIDRHLFIVDCNPAAEKIFCN